ncbi:MAG: glycosyltransferase [Actinobacteria bacterium]|nr:glycosyltransferase [Actinomycetota bacterium]
MTAIVSLDDNVSAADNHAAIALVPPTTDTATARLHPTVGVVIPTLNEAANLPYVLARLPPWIDEVIIVDGHSTDNTVAVALAHRPDATIIMQGGTGKGNALACGFNRASCDITVMLDADGSTDPAEIPRFVAALLDQVDASHGRLQRLRGRDPHGHPPGRVEREGRGGAQPRGQPAQREVEPPGRAGRRPSAPHDHRGVDPASLMSPSVSVVIEGHIADRSAAPTRRLPATPEGGSAPRPAPPRRSAPRAGMTAPSHPTSARLASEPARR